MLRLFPITAEVNNQGHLVIGGCDTVQLAREFGTPLYLFDEDSLRRKCAEFRTEFGQRYADVFRGNDRWNAIETDPNVTAAIHGEWTVGGEPMQLEKIDDYTLKLKFAAPNGLAR